MGTKRSHGTKSTLLEGKQRSGTLKERINDANFFFFFLGPLRRYPSSKVFLSRAGSLIFR